MAEHRARIALLATLGIVVAFAAPRVVRTRRAWRLARELDTRSVQERIRVARALVDLGLRASAADLLLLARTDHDAEVLDALARAVVEVPSPSRPPANERELRQWAAAHLGTAPEAKVAVITPELRVAEGDER